MFTKMLTKYKWAILLTLWRTLVAIPAWADAKPPLNAEGDAGEVQPPLEVIKSVKGTLPFLQDRFAQAKTRAAYQELRKSGEWKTLRAAAARLRSADLTKLTAPEMKTAFWINVYNTLVADGIISLNVKESVRKSPDFFRRIAYNIGGYVFTADEIEHGLLRGNRAPLPGLKPVYKPDDPRLAFGVTEVDPRIHFALNCGARSCPPVSLYDPAKLDAQLNAASKNFIGGPDVRVDRQKKRVEVSRIFEWYAPDFGTEKRDVLRFIAKYRNEADRRYLTEQLDQLALGYQNYDWSLADGF